MAAIIITDVIFPKSRQEWRDWLNKHFDTSKEVWVAIPKKDKPMDYNDVMEEALCFNWIDSTLKTLDDSHTAQRMTPRKTKGKFSQLNIERIRLILAQGLAHPFFMQFLQSAADEPFVCTQDIMAAIRGNDDAWKHFQKFPEAYKRLRIASIEAARGNDILFQNRLKSFIENCAQNKLTKGTAGMEKYY